VTSKVFDTLDVVMKMIRWYTVLLFAFIFFLGCSENKKAVTISEKDIEGYWVSGFLLHNSELSRTIASENSKKPKVQMLRLKNEVNGLADTSYYIDGNKLLYRTGTKRVFNPDMSTKLNPEFSSFLIIFYSKERLVLKDVQTFEETTYYNLSIVPKQDEDFKEIAFGSHRYIWFTINDSIELAEDFDRKKIAVELSWKNDLNMIIQRINWKAAIFSREANNSRKTRPVKDSRGLHPPPPPPPEPGVRSGLHVTTTKHSANWNFSSLDVSDPALSVLLLEMLAFNSYCNNNLPHREMYRCGRR
jgi:hypothetical protein